MRRRLRYRLFARVCSIETSFLLVLAVDSEPKDRRFVPLGASTDLPAAAPCAFTADISAVTIAAELGQVSRFASARQLMGYCGAVPSEDSSGQRTRRGGITKTGNAHLRRIVVEAAWSYRRSPCIWYGLRRRQETISEEVKEIAWKAQQHRLHKRYRKLSAAGKDQRKIVTAVARELLGFIWAIGIRAETISKQQVAA
jgi:transposase